MVRFKYTLFLIVFFSGFILSKSQTRDTIDLSGLWQYRLTGAPSFIPGEGEIILPSTLDESKKSIYNQESDNTTQLRREFSFIGQTDYIREISIPEDWEDKDIFLFLERTKPSVVKIDGKEIGHNSRISSPQVYNLTGQIFPGTHTLEISVNNADSIPPIVARSSHAVSESTQTNWNGILGKILLEARNPVHVKNISINDRDINEHVEITVNLSGPVPSESLLDIFINDNKKLSQSVTPYTDEIKFTLPIEEIYLWSGNNPQLFHLEASLTDSNGVEIDSYKITTGFRNFSTSGKIFTINDQPVFLRGTVNAAVFPITTYAPLDTQSWIDYFNILKEYGFNHVRFHSWTPPDAAFKAADMSGIYILTELPIWGELDRDLSFHNRFLKEELKGIMESYAHHPSLVMFSTGNELWGDLSLMSEYMTEAKNLNPRILATQGSNVYLGMNGKIGGEDFIISSKTDDNVENSIRGSVSFADSSTGGHFNSSYPNSNFNFSIATEHIDVPLISHEVGQYQSYPDFSEIKKYFGNLKPDNLKEFRARALEFGTLRNNVGFTEASGKWATKLYKAEMELAQRSPGIAGFEIFGLQDYPGQGTALIGILDTFMDSKGFVSHAEWQQSSSDLLLLAEFPKFTFTSGETVEIPILKINYTGNVDTVPNINWTTRFDKGRLLSKSGTGIINNGSITFTTPHLKKPEKFNLTLSSPTGDVQNNYDFWIYPDKTSNINSVIVTDNLDYALEQLEEGHKIILCPDTTTISKASIPPLFTTDFFNYRMFRTICDEMNLTPSPGTLGLYIDKTHPVFKKFPTDNHTDWQWYPIIMNSRPLIIDRLPKDFDPIVEVIDNVERNFRLALMLECNVGKGKLIILPVDYDKTIEYPEGRWLLQSIKEYMTSKECDPKFTLTPDQVRNLLTKPSTARLIKELKNETYNRF